jgi:multicomponent Na+:H+ antiporter subunit D
METISSIKPLGAVLVSLIAAMLILLTGDRHRNLREAWTLLAAVIKFSLVFPWWDRS